MDTLEKFNIEAYNKRKENSSYDGYYLKDSTYIRQFGNGNPGYVEYETPPKPEIFQTYREFFSTGSLKIKGHKFPNDFEKGLWKEYDLQGNLVKTIDYDAPYKFSWEDILEIIKERELNMNAYGFEVTRSFGFGSENIGKKTEHPFWAITYNKSEEDMLLGVIIIDGVSGKIMKEFDEPYPTED